MADSLQNLTGFLKLSISHLLLVLKCSNLIMSWAYAINGEMF